MKTDLPPAAGSAPVTSRCTNAVKGSVPFPAIRQPPSGNKDQSGRGAAKKSQLVSPPALRSPPEPRGEGAGGRRPQAGQQRHPVGRESVRPARRPLIPKAPGGSCDSGPASLSGDSAPKSGVNSSRTSPVDVPHGGEEMRFTLSLTPEAVLIIQKRNLERQLLSRRKKPAPAASPAAAAGSSRSDLRWGRRPRDTAPPRPGSPLDITTLLKISLLNDRHKYDDVEYEEEEEEEGGDEAAAEDVMEKCLEWLKGVESAAAAARGGADRLVDLPRLSS